MRSALLLAALAAVGLVGGCGQTARVEPPPEVHAGASSERGARLVGDAPLRASLRGEGYAVLVGIDDYARLAPLKYCARDMETLAETLIEFGGFNPDDVIVMTKQRAERHERFRPSPTNIRAALEDLAGKAAPEDTVLFAFAGHGALRDGRTYLLPFDANPREALSDVNALSVAAIHGFLKKSKAKTKILILDCCHAGGERSDRGAETVTQSEFLDSIPRSPGFVELLACGPDEKSRESDEFRHGLFTYFLVDGIRSGKADANRDGLVSITEVLEYVDNGMGRILRTDWNFQGHRQKPRLRAEDYQGPIYLALAGPKRHLSQAGSASADGEDQRAEPVAIALATLPGLTGRCWWFEEAPWLLPELRINPQHLPSQYSAHRPIEGRLSSADDSFLFPSREELQRAFQNYRRDLQTRDLRRASILASFEDEIRESLADPDRAEKLIAEIRSLNDPHLLALVQHRLRKPEAEESYHEALEYYRKLPAGPLRDCLYAVCRADLGRLQADRNQWSDSAGSFRAARELMNGFGREAAAFRVYARLREIWADRKRPQTSEGWGRLNDEMAAAFREATEAQFPQSHWIYGCLHEDRAWLLMEQWRVTEAKDDFRRARELREMAAESAERNEQFFLRLACYHNEHGLAMATLFSGDLSAARRAYADVFARLEEFREQCDARFRDNDALIRRLQNTAERLGDSFLLVARPEADEALKWYNGAVHYARLLNSGDTITPYVKVLYKRAIAASVLGRPEVAEKDLKEAAAIESTVDQQRECEIFRRAAEGCWKLAIGEQSVVAEARQQLRELLAAELFGKEAAQRHEGGASGSPVPRTERTTGKATATGYSGSSARGYDTLTFLLFVWGRLIDGRPDDDPSLLGDAKLLYLLCPQRLPDPAALRHFLPYHDSALVISLARTEEDLPSDLVAHMWFAITGHRPVWVEREPRLLFYFPSSPGQKGIAVIYQPLAPSIRETLRQFPLDECETDVSAANARNAVLPLPEALQTALRSVGASVRIVWPLYLPPCPYAVTGE